MLHAHLKANSTLVDTNIRYKVQGSVFLLLLLPWYTSSFSLVSVVMDLYFNSGFEPFTVPYSGAHQMKTFDLCNRENQPAVFLAVFVPVEDHPLAGVFCQK